MPIGREATKAGDQTGCRGGSDGEEEEATSCFTGKSSYTTHRARAPAGHLSPCHSSRTPVTRHDGYPLSLLVIQSPLTLFAPARRRHLRWTCTPTRPAYKLTKATPPPSCRIHGFAIITFWPLWKIPDLMYSPTILTWPADTFLLLFFCRLDCELWVAGSSAWIQSTRQTACRY